MFRFEHTPGFLESLCSSESKWPYISLNLVQLQRTAAPRNLSGIKNPLWHRLCLILASLMPLYPSDTAWNTLCLYIKSVSSQNERSISHLAWFESVLSTTREESVKQQDGSIHRMNACCSSKWHWVNELNLISTMAARHADQKLFCIVESSDIRKK